MGRSHRLRHVPHCQQPLPERVLHAGHERPLALHQLGNARGIEPVQTSRRSHDLQGLPASALAAAALAASALAAVPLAATVSATVSADPDDRALHQWLLAPLRDAGRGRSRRPCTTNLVASTAADADLQRLWRKLQLALLHVRAKPAEHARGRQHVRLRRRRHQRFAPLSRGNRAQRHARLGHGHHDRPHRLEWLGRGGRAIRVHW